jgi:type III pantothenate kinase
MMQAVDALLAVDVGNSRIGMGVWTAGNLRDVRRVETHEPRGWRDALEAELGTLNGAKTRGIVIGSVAPKSARQFADLAADIWDVEPLLVRDDIPLPMPLEIDNPDEVGVDRICAAAAAHERLKSACAVASFGTAMTVDFVSSAGHFLGGTILPGLDMGCAALHAGTAGLPRVTPELPAGPLGRNTRDAIIGGVVYGAVGALREIVERFATEHNEWPTLVITGGNAPLIMQLADFVDAVVPDLCLMGVALAYRRAAGQP